MADHPPYPGTPLWAKVLGIIAIILILLFVVVLFTRGPGGRHGPERHPPSDGAAGQASLSAATTVHAKPDAKCS